MTQRKLYLFGPPRLEPTAQTTHIRGRKVWALGAYLALNQRSHSRDHLATLFWPGYDQSGARANLRRELSKLNKLWGKDVLSSERETVEFVAGADLWIDVIQFQTCLAGCPVHAGNAEAGCSDCLSLSAEAVDLYQADFLSGFSLSDSPDFDEWQFFQSESLRRSLITSLERLVVAVNDPEKALTYAQRWVSLDPLQESAHQAVMRMLAQQGQRTAALRQYERCAEILDKELGLAPNEATQALHTTIRQGDLRPPEPVTSKNLVEIPAAAQAPRPSHNLPAQRSAFIGREAELSRLADLLAQVETRLITLLGPGGIGKTRLALETGQRRLEAFRDGVWFMALAGLDAENFSESINPLVTSLADVLGFRFQGDSHREQQLLQHLQDQQCLFIFDNLEHLLERSDFIGDILLAAPQSKVLVTSQGRLHLQSEWLFSVSGLAVTGDSDPSQSGTRVSDAIQLFAQRAQQTQPDFDLKAEMAWVSQICQLVGGMPLAIELAATWVRHMPPQRIAQEIEADIDFLASKLRDLPARHRSLRAIFDHAWRLLSPQEQEQFCRLAVFRGGFRREEAQAVAGTTLLDLTTLVDKSLLQYPESERYDWHEQLRQYALAKLRQDPATYEGIRRQHCLVYLKLSANFDMRASPPQVREAVAVLAAEMDNMRVAWLWAIEHHYWDEIEAMEEAMGQFYHAENSSTGQALFEKLVMTLKQALANSKAEAEAESSKLSLILGRALGQLAFLQAVHGLRGVAIQNMEEAIALLRSLGPSAARDLAWSLVWAGMSTHRTVDGHRQSAYLQESLALYQACDDTAGQGFALVFLGAVAFSFGQYDLAESYAQEGLRLGEIEDAAGPLAVGAGVLARIAQSRGHYQVAEAWLHKEQYAALHQGLNLNNLGNIARLQGYYDQAKTYFLHSLELARKSNEHNLLSEIFLGLGALAEDQGYYDQARRHFQEAWQNDNDVRSYSVSARNGLGRVALVEGDLALAKQHFTATAKMLVAMQTAPEALEALAGLAEVHAQSGDLEQALDLLSLVLNHPSTEQETKDRIADLHAELLAELPPPVIEVVQARAQNRDLWETMAELGEAWT